MISFFLPLSLSLSRARAPAHSLVLCVVCWAVVPRCCRDRHLKVAQELWQGLEELGLELVVKNPEDRLVPLTTGLFLFFFFSFFLPTPCSWNPTSRLRALPSVFIPEGVDGKEVQGYLMSKYKIEIAGGLSQFAGKVDLSISLPLFLLSLSLHLPLSLSLDLS